VHSPPDLAVSNRLFRSRPPLSFENRTTLSAPGPGRRDLALAPRTGYATPYPCCDATKHPACTRRRGVFYAPAHTVSRTRGPTASSPSGGSSVQHLPARRPARRRRALVPPRIPRSGQRVRPLPFPLRGVLRAAADATRPPRQTPPTRRAGAWH